MKEEGRQASLSTITTKRKCYIWRKEREPSTSIQKRNRQIKKEEHTVGGKKWGTEEKWKVNVNGKKKKNNVQMLNNVCAYFIMVICVRRFICKSMKTIYHAKVMLLLLRYCCQCCCCYRCSAFEELLHRKIIELWNECISCFSFFFCTQYAMTTRSAVKKNGKEWKMEMENCPQETIFHTA